MRDLFLQVIAIMRCLRDDDWWYVDIKPSNFLVQDLERGPQIEIGDLGGLVRYGSKNVTISPSQLPKDTVAQLTWANLNSVISTLLGELLIQMLCANPTTDDTNRPISSFFGCLVDQSKPQCEKDLLVSIRANLATGLSLDDELVVDLLATGFLLLGYRGMKLEWQDVTALASPMNSLNSL